MGPSTADDHSPGPEVRAAGGVVRRWRDDVEQIALVHRPRYDDWSFPKGKLDPGEDWLDAAVREVFEEIDVVGVPRRELASAAYRDHKDRSKLVRYWEMTVAVEGAFQADDEVDEVRWVTRAEARRLLTYVHDHDVLDSLPADHRSAHESR